MYYEALKDKSQDIKAKALESIISSADSDELPQKLKELIDAADSKDVSATAAADVSGGEEYSENGVLQIYDEQEKYKDLVDAEAKKAADFMITAGEEFGGVHVHSENKVADAVADLMFGEKYVGENSFKMPVNLVTTRKRPRLEGMRRQRKRRRRRKNRLSNHGSTAYADNETITNALQVSHSDERHSRDVNEDDEVLAKKSKQGESPQTESSVSEKSDITKKPAEGARFDWQKPAGQWHLPTGQFQPISVNLENFARSERRRNNLFRSAGMKYMVYTGQLDNKMDAN